MLHPQPRPEWGNILLSAWDGTLSVHAILTERKPTLGEIARWKLGGKREVRDQRNHENGSPGNRSGAFSEPGERESARLACKARVVYHRDCLLFPTTPRRALASLAGARRRVGTKIPWNCHGLLTEPRLGSRRELQHVAPRSCSGRGGGESGGTDVVLQNASGSLALRSGLVVCAKPEC